MSRKDTTSEVRGTTAEVLEIIEDMEGPSSSKEKNKKPKAPSEDNDIRKAKGEAQENATKTRKPKEKAKPSTNITGKSTQTAMKERWQIDKAALQQKFGGEGWKPRKRLSPDTLEGIRALHASDPATYSTPTLAAHFQVTPEAIRRILKSKWQPSAEDAANRMERWEKRGLKKWAEMAEQGMRPPKKWRAMGVGKDIVEEERREAERREEERRKKKIDERKAKDATNWNDAVEAAARLPMEGSFADRIL